MIRSLLSRFPRFVALCALALFFLFGGWNAARVTFRNFHEAARLRGESSRAARQRCLGSYALGVERIKAALPLDAEYFLVEGEPTGAHSMVQYDLAPRRSRYIGDGPPTVEGLRRMGRPPHSPHWVIVTLGASEAPRLMTAEEFFVGIPIR